MRCDCVYAPVYVCVSHSFSARVLFISDGHLSTEGRFGQLNYTPEGERCWVAWVSVLLTLGRVSFKCRYVNTEAQCFSVTVTTE